MNRFVHPAERMQTALVLAALMSAWSGPLAAERATVPSVPLVAPTAPQRSTVQPNPITVPQAPALSPMAPAAAAVPPDIPAAPQAALPSRPQQPVMPLAAVPAELLARDAVSVSFAAGSDALDGPGLAVLDAVALRLAARPGERLELRAHAAGAGEDDETPARRLSLARARAVREHLISKGVDKHRLIVFAMGRRGEGDLDRVDLAFK